MKLETSDAVHDGATTACPATGAGAARASSTAADTASASSLGSITILASSVFGGKIKSVDQ